jgi:hypothetical protein
MTTSHTPGKSFEKALKALETNAVDTDAIKAIKVCQAADELLAALRDLTSAEGLPDRFADRRMLIAAARAAIARATA